MNPLCGVKPIFPLKFKKKDMKNLTPYKEKKITQSTQYKLSDRCAKKLKTTVRYKKSTNTCRYHQTKKIFKFKTYSRCFGIMRGHGNLRVKVSVAVGYVFLSLRL
jgi:hypothetical protein